jgi:hypothetical protein
LFVFYQTNFPSSHRALRWKLVWKVLQIDTAAKPEVDVAFWAVLVTAADGSFKLAKEGKVVIEEIQHGNHNSYSYKLNQ